MRSPAACSEPAGARLALGALLPVLQQWCAALWFAAGGSNEEDVLTAPEAVVEMVASAVSELDGEIVSIAETDLVSVTRAVDAIELMASQERRLRLRTW